MYWALRYIPYIFWKRALIQLTFFVTRKCNLKCPFCFYLSSATVAREPEWGRPINPSPSRGEGLGEGEVPPPSNSLPPGEGGLIGQAQPELTLNEIEKLSRSLGRLLWLAFSGGEPFLRDDLVEISQSFYDNNRPAIMLFSTNGQFPELIASSIEQILKYCQKSIIVVKLSLDGLESVHDALRGKPGCFATTLETYYRLESLLDRYSNFDLGINTLLCSENQHEMDNVIEFVSKLKNIRTHTITLVRGDLLNEHYKNVSPQNYDHAVRKLEENFIKVIYRFRGARIKAAQDILQHRLIHQTMLARKRLTPCYAGRLNLVLRENGDVYPCELYSQSLGNVRDFGYDMKALLRTDRARYLQQAIRNGDCYCTHECYMITNILFNLRWYPTLARLYFSLLVRSTV